MANGSNILAYFLIAFATSKGGVSIEYEYNPTGAAMSCERNFIMSTAVIHGSSLTGNIESPKEEYISVTFLPEHVFARSKQNS